MEGNSINIFENLCKIFEMRIKLDKTKGKATSKEIVDNYEKYAQKIDSYYNDKFQKELKSLISPEETLEKEKDRLEKLIDLLENRLEKRDLLSNNFYIATGKYIKNLQLIVSDSELKNKKERLSLITKYLETIKEMDDIKDSKEKLINTLSLEEARKEEYLTKNKMLEDELYSSFVTCISDDEYYNNIEEENLITILNEVSDNARDAKETLDITEESVKSLLSSGMDDEYESYVEEASKNYSLWKNREIILKIYKLVINFEDNFEDIFNKRNIINELLEERKGININNDKFVDFEKLMSNQVEILNDEKEVIENVSNCTSRIEFKNERLNELEKVVKEPEILVILSEYNLIDDSPSLEEGIEDESIDGVENNDSIQDNDDLVEDNNIVTREYNPYEIVSIDDSPSTLNISLAKLKGASVRDKVNRKLNPEKVSVPVFDFDLNLEDTNNNLLNDNNNVDSPSDSLSDEKDVLNIENDKDNNTLPVNDTNKDEKKFDLYDKVDENINSNSFWVPVSDSKLETSEFPNINIPIMNGQLKKDDDNFGFPEFNS